LPKIFGVKGGGVNFFERISTIIQNLPEANWTVFAFGMVALALLILGDYLFPGKPVSLVAVILSILVVSFTSLAASGIHITGDIPSGLPTLGRPSLRLTDVNGVVPLGFACFLMGYIETISAARTFAMKNNYDINPRQERIYHLSQIEFVVAMIALIGVLMFGILTGVMIAAIMSIALMIRRVANPHVAVLGRIGATDRYSDISRHPDNNLIEGALILRIESSLLYFNADHVYGEIRDYLMANEGKLKLVILDLSSTSFVDVSASKMLLRLSNELRDQGISFRIVEALSNVRDILRKLGMEEITGHISRKTSIQSEVDAFLAQAT
jgi:MFS superfamily sulfate permease-like transporter